MEVKKNESQILDYIASMPLPKRQEVNELYQIILQLLPDCKLWFFDGTNSENKIVSNPNIGFGFQLLKYANGKTKEWFQIGISGNKTGISIYILGIKDKNYLLKTYGQRLSKASVTGYCIKFKTLKDVDIEILKEAICDGFVQTVAE